MRCVLVALFLLMLVGCGAVNRPPSQAVAPTASLSHVIPTANTATAIAVVVADSAINSLDELKARLKEDDVLVNSVELANESGGTLTIDYNINEQRVVNDSSGVVVALAIETERSLLAITQRVASLHAAGTKIGQVILLYHEDSGVPITIKIPIQDMLDWSKGQLSTDDYRLRWSKAFTS